MTKSSQLAIINNEASEEDNEEIHYCKNLGSENIERKKWYEQSIYIYKDLDGKLNMRVGVEYLVIKYCPFCGEKQ